MRGTAPGAQSARHANNTADPARGLAPRSHRSQSARPRERSLAPTPCRSCLRSRCVCEGGRGSSAAVAVPRCVLRVLVGCGVRLGRAPPDQSRGGAHCDSGGADPNHAVELPIYRGRVRPGTTGAVWVRGVRVLRVGASEALRVRRDRGSSHRSVPGERRAAGLPESSVHDENAREAPDRSTQVQRHGDHRAVQSVLRL